MPPANDRFNPPNAILYAQFCIGGGKRTFIGGTVAALAGAAIVFFAIFASMTSHGGNTAKVWAPCMGLMMAGEVLLLALAGMSSISGAIRRDLQTGMIESHRLTPDRSMAAAVGYLLGPLAAYAGPIAITAIGWLIAMILIGQPLEMWLWWQATLFAAVILLWSAIAVLTFVTHSGAAWVLVLIIGTMLIRVLLYVPGVLALVGPAFAIARGTSPEQEVLCTIAIACEGLVAVTFLVAVARMYRSAAADGFGVLQSTVLLAVWTVLTGIGVAEKTLIDPQRFAYNMNPLTAALLGWISVLLVALPAISAAARVASRPADTYSPADRPKLPATRWLLLPLYAVAAWIPFELVRGNDFIVPPPTSAALLCVGLIFVFSSALVFAASTLVRSSGWLALFLWQLIASVAPLLVSAGYAATQDRFTRDPDPVAFLQAVSPFGIMGVIAGDPAHTPWAPIGIQAVLALGPLLLYLGVARKARRRVQLAAA